MVIDLGAGYRGLFPNRVEIEQFKKKISGTPSKISGSSLGAGTWQINTFTATTDCILAGVIYYLNITATASSYYDWYVSVENRGTYYDIVQLTENSVMNFGIQSVYFKYPIYLRPGDKVAFFLYVATNTVTLNFWGDVIATEAH